jgi:hypothetical protein
MSARPGAKPVQDRFQRRRLVNRVKAANSLLIDLVDIEGAEIQRSHPHRSSKGRLLPLPSKSKHTQHASIAVAVVVLALVVWGLRWTWHRIKRYRLAIGFAALTVGFGIIRFISLHEVDAWNAHAPWARTAVDLVAAAGVSAVAIARLYRLRDARNR